jgi:S-formylglutathione hydrolase FrmB
LYTTPFLGWYFICRELVNFIDKNYRTLTDRHSRAISCLSMGGHRALFLPIRHRDLYGAAGSTRGVVDFPSPGKLAQGQQYPSDSAYHPENLLMNSVMNLSDDLKNGDLHLIIDCGVSDWLCPVNLRLPQKLLARKIDHDYIARPGKHEVVYWRNSIDDQLLSFKKYFIEGNMD